MLTEKIINLIFADLNKSASREWRDDRHLKLVEFQEREDDEIYIEFVMGKDDTTLYRASFAPEGWEYDYEGSGSNIGDAEGIMQLLMDQYDSAHYLVIEPCDDPDYYTLRDEENGISVTWRVGAFNETQKFDASGFDLNKYGAESAQIIATITRRMGDWLYENYPELVFELNDRQLFGLKIARIRRSKGISIRELAQRSECSPSTIVNIEQGKFSPRVEIVEKILSILGCRLEIVEADIIEDDLDDDIDDIFLN